MKVFFKYVLSLLLVLLSGYPSAHSSECSTTFSPIKKLESSDHVSISRLQNNLALAIKPNLYDTKEAQIKIKATEVEEEDEELPTQKRGGGVPGHLISFLHTYTSGNFHDYHIQRLPFCKHFSYLSSLRYISLCVLRI